MICSICRKDVCAGKIIPHWGFGCSEECLKIIHEKRDKVVQELKDEILVDNIPERLDLEAFERFMLKVAIHYITDMPAKVKKQFEKKAPLLLRPEELALEFKDKVLKFIPSGFFSSKEARGHARLFFSGTYTMENNIPRKVLFKALKEARIVSLEEVDEEDDEEGAGHGS